MAFLIQPGQTVLFTGDSITDCGRRAEHRPLGAGYARMAADLITARYPEHACRVVNTGIGGNTVRNLLDRWTDDCISWKPDWVSVLVGINDLHQWLGGGVADLGPEGFEELYARILGRVKAETDARLVLMAPFYLSYANPTDDDGWAGRVMAALPAYIAATERMAEQFGAVYLDTHAIFQRRLNLARPEAFGEEAVHPNATGHLVMAYEWLTALGW